MLRKFGLVIIAVSTLSVASLSPTPASAWRGGWYGGGGTAAAGVGVADGRPGWQVGWGPAGDLDGDAGAVGPDGHGADHVSSWRQDFMEADASSGVLSVARGDRAGFS